MRARCWGVFGVFCWMLGARIKGKRCSSHSRVRAGMWVWTLSARCVAAWNTPLVQASALPPLLAESEPVAPPSKLCPRTGEGDGTSFAVNSDHTWVGCKRSVHPVLRYSYSGRPRGKGFKAAAWLLASMEWGDGLDRYLDISAARSRLEIRSRKKSRSIATPLPVCGRQVTVKQPCHCLHSSESPYTKQLSSKSAQTLTAVPLLVMHRWIGWTGPRA